MAISMTPRVAAAGLQRRRRARQVDVAYSTPWARLVCRVVDIASGLALGLLSAS